jgi:multisubunit Na+/H+ antiporter MnhG subunit
MAVVIATLAIGAGVVTLLASLGMFAMRDAVDRLHYLGPVTTIAPALMALAIVLEDGITSQAGLKALCVATLILATSPLIQYVTLRAIVTRRHGSPDPPVPPELQM